MRPHRNASALENDDFTLAPPPADIVEPVSVAQSFGYSRGSRGNTRAVPRRAGAFADEGGEQYRLSTPPADQEPAVAIAQGYDPRRRKRARQFAVVEIVSAVVGAVMTRILDNEGDVKWELDQLNGAQHPDGATATPSTSTYSSKRVPVEGVWIENGFADRITADFEITFQYNGASVGYIQVSNTGTNDAVGWGLTVKETIMPDPNTYTTVPPDGKRFAAIKVRFEYRFDRSIGSDAIALRELTLFGNGSVRDEWRWTQS
ncbi:MAG TPA: hypothetical protein VIP11_19690 [Gemmatimonadaceae bacterium]